MRNPACITKCLKNGISGNLPVFPGVGKRFTEKLTFPGIRRVQLLVARNSGRTNVGFAALRHSKNLQLPILKPPLVAARGMPSRVPNMYLHKAPSAHR